MHGQSCVARTGQCEQRRVPGWYGAENTHVNEAVARGLGTNKTAAPAEAFASQNASPDLCLLLVRSKHPTNLTPRDSNVSSWDICIDANVLAQLGHKRGAELADFII